MTDHRILNAKGLFCSVDWIPVLTQHTSERLQAFFTERHDTTSAAARALALITRLPVHSAFFNTKRLDPFSLNDIAPELAHHTGNTPHALGIDCPTYAVPHIGPGSNKSSDHPPVSFPLSSTLSDFSALADLLTDLAPLLPALETAAQALDHPGTLDRTPFKSARQHLAKIFLGAYTLREVDPVRERAEAHSAVIYQPMGAHVVGGGAFVGADGFGSLDQARHFESVQAAHRTAKAKGLSGYAVCTTDVTLTGGSAWSSAMSDELRAAIAHVERVQMVEMLNTIDLATLRARVARLDGHGTEHVSECPSAADESRTDLHPDDPHDSVRGLITCDSAVLYVIPKNSGAPTTPMGGFVDKHDTLGPLGAARHFSLASEASRHAVRQGWASYAACTTSVRLTGVDPASPGTSPELSAAVAHLERQRMIAMLDAMDVETLRARAATLERSDPVGDETKNGGAGGPPKRRM